MNIELVVACFNNLTTNSAKYLAQFRAWDLQEEVALTGGGSGRRAAPTVALTRSLHVFPRRRVFGPGSKWSLGSPMRAWSLELELPTAEVQRQMDSDDTTPSYHCPSVLFSFSFVTLFLPFILRFFRYFCLSVFFPRPSILIIHLSSTFAPSLFSYFSPQFHLFVFIWTPVFLKYSPVTLNEA